MASDSKCRMIDDPKDAEGPTALSRILYAIFSRGWQRPPPSLRLLGISAAAKNLSIGGAWIDSRLWLDFVFCFATEMHQFLPEKTQYRVKGHTSRQEKVYNRVVNRASQKATSDCSPRASILLFRRIFMKAMI
jgi:hypothetical protein